MRDLKQKGLAVTQYGPERDAEAAFLLVHGFGSMRTGEKYQYLGQELGGAVLTFDQQGHGDSEGGMEGLCLERSIADLLAVAELPAFATARRRFLVGSSFGALVAAWAAVRQPALCERLVLMAPAFGFLERHLAAIGPDWERRWRVGELLPIVNQWIDVRLSNRVLLEAPQFRRDELAARLPHPTLLIHGKCDEVVPYEESVRFAAACPKADLLLLAGGDHRLTAWKETLRDQIRLFCRG